jgi:hypothetical protein
MYQEENENIFFSLFVRFVIFIRHKILISKSYI